MQRIVSEEEWNGHWQDGFMTGVNRNPQMISRKEFERVKVELLSHLGHWGPSAYSKYRPVVEMIIDQLDPANPGCD